MRFVFSFALALALVPNAFSQTASPGFPAVNNSNILHPAVPPRVAQQRPAGRPANVGTRRYYGGGAVLPYAGYIDPFYAGEVAPDPAYSGYPQPQQPPTIIINQNFQPETIHPQLKDYSNVALPEPGVVIPAPGTPVPAAAVDDQKPNMFLIAMKDQSVTPALAYWVQDGTLNYITLTGAQNHVSLSLVDRELSTRLNAERQVQFRLPAGRP